MEAVTSIGGAVLSASFQALFDKLGSPDLLKYYASRSKVVVRFKKWEAMMVKIHAVLDDAEEKQVSNRLVKIWVRELRDLAYDLEDVLDEFSTEVRRRKMRAEPAAKNPICKFIGDVPLCLADTVNLRGAKVNAKMVSKMKRITERLQEITVQKDELDLREGRGGNWKSQDLMWDRPPTTCLVNEAKVYGREKDKDALVEMLMGDGPNTYDSEICVIPILGMGGIGKTTLAQLVFNDARLEFDLRTWVSVGEDFDVFKITKQILQLTNCDGEDLNSLQLALKEKLSGKNFLIVLDDVWNESYDNWTLFLGAFEGGESGSRIMVTTRNESVSAMVGTAPAYCVGELVYDDCFSVFAQHALGEKKLEAHTELMEIGKQIVNKCGGLPLAAKALGGLLRGRLNLTEWQVVLDSKIWNLPEKKNGILPALWLSYQHLPPQLKRCFAYCAVFPKDHEFDKKELVLLWMAEGFLHHPNGMIVKPAQNLGYQYFDELLSRSFFQVSNSSRSKYAMHDLISDLAHSVSGDLCFNLDDSTGCVKSYANVRHSSFTRHLCDISQRFEVLYQMKNLRTFLSLPIFPSPYHQLTFRVIHDLVLKLKCLRVLSLAGYSLMNLPESIGALKHLRYLNLAYSEIVKLPESVSELINLQTLIVSWCLKLVALPSGISNLVNLEYLDIMGTDSLQEMPLKIGNLSKLHILPKFIVGTGNGLGIIELAKFSQLEGQLCIKGLHNVVDARGAEIANLKEKQFLENLTLEWVDSFHGQRDENHELLVINSLKPHQNLQKLSVKFYAGLKFPLWMSDPTFSNIVELEILDCLKIGSLPPIGQLPSLAILSIKGMNGVREVGCELYGDISASGMAFPSLRILHIENMLEWRHWSWLDGLPEEAARGFPSLSQLSIINCPKLAGKLPKCLPSLWKLKVCQCPLLNNLPQFLPSLHELIVEECQAMLLESAPDLNYLKVLRISRISGLKSLQESLMRKMVALEVLEINSCNDMIYLIHDGTGFDKLQYLKYVKIKHCGMLFSLVERDEGLLPCSVKVLRLEQCHNLKKLPDGLSSLTTLRTLNVDGCPNLKGFPATGLPVSIECLWIRDCKSLESVPEGLFHYGNDRMKMPHLKILHIRNCPSLKASETGELPVSLKTIYSSHFTSQSLDSLDNQFGHLTFLGIAECPRLQRFPEGGLSAPFLTYLIISGCQNLSCLPDQMQNLTSIQYFEIHDCARVVSFPGGGLPPNLTTLRVRNCKNLSQPISSWGLHRLTSLKRLKLEGTSPSTNMVTFPDEDGLLLPSSLTMLWMHSLNNLKRISMGLKNLKALENMWIWNCPKLESLPKTGLPDTLGFLEINACPFLTNRLRKGFHKSRVSQIPCVVVDSMMFDKPLNPEFMSQYLVHTWGHA
ncbi:unnamed protein product [Linum trigynum]|uniref:Disease resistance RPP13-like protein 1 n=1 Tax=Linum trigynum TaxID=586398 RepID=A0AAV2FVE9_9ROSI